MLSDYIKYHDKMLDHAIKRLDQNKTEIAHLSQVLGWAEQLNKSLMLSRQHLTQAVLFSEHAYGPHHHQVALTMHILSYVLELSDELAHAEHLYRQALSIRLQNFGLYHESVTSTKAGIILLLFHQGALSQALEHHTDLEQIRMKLCPKPKSQLAHGYKAIFRINA